MRIGYLIPEFPGQTHVFFWREIVALRRLGAEVALVSTRRPGKPCRHEFAAEGAKETHYVYPPAVGSLVELLKRPGGVVRALAYLASLRQTPVRRRLKYLGLIWCAADMRRWCARAGIEHVHSHSCADSAHVVAMCHLLNGPSYSLTLHGDLPVYGTDHGSKVRRALFVATDGAHLTKQLVDVGLPESRVYPTLMGLDTSDFVPPARRSEGKALHLVTVARLDPCKGHKYALEAVARVVKEGVDVRYTIAGSGAGQADLEREIERLGIGEKVQLAGSKNEGEVLELLREADVFVLPSVGLGEAWPISVMEAMSCGLPVVCSRIGGTPLMIRDGEDGLLVDQKDVGGLASAIRSLAEDPRRREAIGQAARAKAVAQFDCRHTAKGLLDRIIQAKRADTGGRAEMKSATVELAGLGVKAVER